MTDGNRIETEESSRDLVICDEHMYCILNRVAYLLLMKTDQNTAKTYYYDWNQWLEHAKGQINAGRNNTTRHGEVRDPYWSENSFYYGGVL